jgi:UDP-glucose 4-epimerase
MILITGGTGYIGSHTAVELMAAGRDVFIIDNLCNSKASVLDRIERIAGRRPGFAQIDVRDARARERADVVSSLPALHHACALGRRGGVAPPAAMDAPCERPN